MGMRNLIETSQRKAIASNATEADETRGLLRGIEVQERLGAGVGESTTNADLYTGTLPMFERAGFREVARREGRPIVRLG